MNCKQPTEKRLAVSASEIVNHTKSSEKAIPSVCIIKIKVWTTVVAIRAMNLKNYKKWLNAIESEPKSTRAIGSDVAVGLRSVLNIAKKVTGTRWAFKVKSDRRFKARQVVLGWRPKHCIDCGITCVCRFNLLVTASAKRVNIPDVQFVLLSWFLDKNKLKPNIHLSKMYRAKECLCSESKDIH